MKRNLEQAYNGELVAPESRGEESVCQCTGPCITGQVSFGSDLVKQPTTAKENLLNDAAYVPHGKIMHGVWFA